MDSTGNGNGNGSAFEPDEDGGHDFGSEIFEVGLPAGGVLYLRSAEEKELFEGAKGRYVQDYNLSRENDLTLLGVILSHTIEVYRAQQEQNGMTPEVLNGVPTGKYKMVEMKPADKASAQTRLVKAASDIREIEKQLGIDKKTREAGGTYSVENYIMQGKKAVRKFGLHIQRRVKLHERFANEMRWRIRLLRNGDDEDKRYHGITEGTIIDLAEQMLAKIEDEDKRFAKNHHSLVVGKM